MSTVGEIIDALGGTTAVAKKLNTTPSRISNWRSFNRFPDLASVHRQISDLCAAEGIDLDVSLFEARRATDAA